ncbi:MAG: hypothetical protein AMXMBFR64_50350 [Myxococcales bacterium]
MTEGVFTIEPRDTLVLRDGRPSLEGEPMRTLPFPWPSSVAGCVRTHLGLDDTGRFGLTVAQAKEIVVRGPLLYRLDDGEVFVPPPADCLWNWPADGVGGSLVERRRLVPDDLGADFRTDLSGASDLRLLRAVDGGMPKSKAAPAPALWSWSDLEVWLREPPSGREVLERSKVGREALTVEQRTHVSIDPTTGTAAEGMLFSTEGLRFGGRNERLGLLFRCESPWAEPLRAKCAKNGTVTLGGEQRLSRLAAGEPRWWPSMTVRFGAPRTVRLVLLTPGIFADGWCPGDLGGGRIVAAAVGRPQVISGWSFETEAGRKPGPKPVRRMAPAGSVYWVELPEGTDVSTWAAERWLRSICDDEQDRRDGFGLCAVGVA